MVRLLTTGIDEFPGDSVSTKDQLLQLLPAVFRSELGELGTVTKHPFATLERELDLARLCGVYDWLWLTGLPMPPRPLHYQLLMRREIIIAERMDMHLVWTTGRLFLKPLPRYLLEPQFWSEYLACVHGCDCEASSAGAKECQLQRLRRRALGFVFSYAALISFESDFQIAKEKRLIPSEVQWAAWRLLIQELDLETMYARIDKRFHYGELRLSRLNFIYAVSRTPFHGYLPRWSRYSMFVRDNFAFLAASTVYVAITLTAMQVGLATDALVHNSSFQSASYGMSVFSILGPFVAGVLIIVTSCGVFIVNVVRAIQFKNQRLKLRGLK